MVDDHDRIWSLRRDLVAQGGTAAPESLRAKRGVSSIPAHPPVIANRTGVAPSDRGGAQRLAPMRNPLLESALTPVGQLLKIDLCKSANPRDRARDRNL